MLEEKINKFLNEFKCEYISLDNTTILDKDDFDMLMKFTNSFRFLKAEIMVIEEILDEMSVSVDLNMINKYLPIIKNKCQNNLELLENFKVIEQNFIRMIEIKYSTNINEILKCMN